MLALAAWALRPALRSIWGIGFLAVLVHALFDYPFSRPATGAWPILMLALVAVARHRSILKQPGLRPSNERGWLAHPSFLRRRMLTGLGLLGVTRICLLRS